MQWKTQKLKDIAFTLLDPMIRRRTGLNFEVVENWPLIVGTDVALLCSPIKLIWPYAPASSNNYKPATLLISCAGAAAVQIMHQNLQIIERVNSFFGYYAIDKIKITQQAVGSEVRAVSIENSSVHSAAKRKISREQEVILGDLLKNIQDEGLKTSLLKIGRSIYKDVIAKKV